MKKIAVIGHFAFGKEYLDGQTVKTKVLAKTLIEKFGDDQIICVDSYGWKKRPITFFYRILRAARKVNDVIILPAHNGLKVIAPLLHYLTNRRRVNLHYAVVGGWLPSILKNDAFLRKSLADFAGIYVETRTMKGALEQLGFTNIELMPNCKDLQVLQPEQLPQNGSPYKLCTFSRVQQEKGIEDAVDAVRAINRARGETVYTLDIYGPVDTDQIQWFEELKKSFPPYVSYNGAVPYDQSIAVLKDYFALLFPTHYFTEGVPGTIIDAYASGVPVIAAKWESFDDVVDDTVTGYGYQFDQYDQLLNLLKKIADNPKMIIQLRTNCLHKAKAFMPETVLSVLIQKLEG